MDFLAEYTKLQLATPRLSFFQLNSANSEYCYNCENAKNCYLIANAVNDENCMYGRDFYDDVDCTDCDHTKSCTLCYQCLNCQNCYNSDYLQDSSNCNDCKFGYYLKGCKDCVGCVGLKQKQFCIFNEQYTEEEYRKKLATMSDEEIQSGMEKLKLQIPRIASWLVDTENCTGDNLFHCQNVHESFDASECQDSGYLLETKKLKDCWDITVLEDSELCYEVSSSHVLQNCTLCFFCVHSSNCEYSELMINSHDCFGCISLHRKQYYILNQPYTKEEYFKKVAEIKDDLRAKGLYGQMFLPSAFPRQDTVAVWDRM